MRILIIKTSSMGDIVHTLPAITDAKRAMPHLIIDWVVEDAFQEIPQMHAAVNNIMTVAIRRWRKNIFKLSTWREIAKSWRALRANPYDLIIDAQGLIKSALLTKIARGTSVGYDRDSIREPFAAFFYQTNYQVSKNLHAVDRIRHLFAAALQYPRPASTPDFNLTQNFLNTPNKNKYVVFLHGTTWLSKEWPEKNWLALSRLASAAGFGIKISGKSEREIERAYRLQANNPVIEVHPNLHIAEMAEILANAVAVVSVDTGFGHLAAALNKPTIAIFGASNPALAKPIGQYSKVLFASEACAPCLSRKCQNSNYMVCYARITPQLVWTALQEAYPLDI